MATSKRTVRSGKAAGKTAKAKSRHKRFAVSKRVRNAGPREYPAKAIAVVEFFNTDGTVKVAHIVKRFGMSKQQFAETIGVKPETVYRATRVSAPKTQTRATEMLEIVSRIADWAGGERQAMAWYRAEPIAAFGGRTAESLVKEGKAAAVRDYLDHIATGGFA